MNNKAFKITFSIIATLMFAVVLFFAFFTPHRVESASADYFVPPQGSFPDGKPFYYLDVDGTDKTIQYVPLTSNNNISLNYCQKGYIFHSTASPASTSSFKYLFSHFRSGIYSSQLKIFPLLYSNSSVIPVYYPYSYSDYTSQTVSVSTSTSNNSTVITFSFVVSSGSSSDTFCLIFTSDDNTASDTLYTFDWSVSGSYSMSDYNSTNYNLGFYYLTYSTSTSSISSFVRLLFAYGCSFQTLVCSDLESSYYYSNYYYNKGYDAGYSDGFAAGQSAGDNQVYLNGYNDGYANGYETGKNSIASQFQTSWQQGYDSGFAAGQAAGGAENASFMGLISAVVDAPIKAFTSLLDFEIFGVNLSSFLLALFSVCIILSVVRLVI